MSFGARLKWDEVRLGIGQTYSNDLQPRFEEHRRILAFRDADQTVTKVRGVMVARTTVLVDFIITVGRPDRVGCKGNCKPETFWRWARKEVV